MNGRVRLCFATRDFKPAFSGAAIRISRYAPVFRERGVDMKVLAGTPLGGGTAGDAVGIGAFLPVEIVDDLEVRRVRLPNRGMCSRNFAFASALVKHCSQSETRPDIIHTISISQCWLPWYFAIRNLDLPIVSTITMISEFSPNPVRRLQQHFYRRIPYRFGDCIVVSSKAAARYVRSLGVRKRIEVITNGVDLERFRPVGSVEVKKRIRLDLGLDPTAEVVLYVGDLIRRKGVDTLLEAWEIAAARRPDSILVLVGPVSRSNSSDPNREPIDLSAIPPELKHRIVLPGKVETVEEYYRAADLFVFPSRREGFGNVVLEAYASGLPAILTPFIGLSEELGQPGSEYCRAERTPEHLAQTMVDLLANPGLRQRYANQGRRWAETRMGIDCSVEAYVDLYRDLLKTRAKLSTR